MPVINVENAQIKTAAIEIKALTVSGKQVTQSVFKQLQEDCCIDFDSVTLKGLVWGHVNFQVDRSELNIVWQLGKELKRGILQKQIKYFSQDDYHYFFNKKLFLNDIFLYIDLFRIQDRLKYGTNDYKDGLYSDTLSSIKSEMGREWIKEEKLLQLKNHFAERIEKLKEAEINISNQINVINNKINKYNKLLESLSDVPQLFIAV